MRDFNGLISAENGLISRHLYRARNLAARRTAHLPYLAPPADSTRPRSGHGCLVDKATPPHVAHRNKGSCGSDGSAGLSTSRLR
jgi:hypothetical protein